MEWKHPGIQPVRPLTLALETSLVEWKHPDTAEFVPAEVRLGNFLSGMETRVCGVGDRCVPTALETSLVEWKQGFPSK